MIGTVVLFLGSVPWVKFVYGDAVCGAVVVVVVGAVVVGSGHVNTPTFVESQIRSLTKVHNRKIMHSPVRNSKQWTKKINIRLYGLHYSKFLICSPIKIKLIAT